MSTEHHLEMETESEKERTFVCLEGPRSNIKSEKTMVCTVRLSMTVNGKGEFEVTVTSTQHQQQKKAQTWKSKPIRDVDQTQRNVFKCGFATVQCHERSLPRHVILKSEYGQDTHHTTLTTFLEAYRDS